jgi:purine-nucleoside phosphorylase
LRTDAVSSDYEHLVAAADVVRNHGGDGPEVAVVLGSGLGEFASRLVDAKTLAYGRIPHWPESRVAGHEGRLVIGRLGGRRVAALAGRVHLYEGHGAPTVAFAVRVMGLLGASALIVTNAAGGINRAFTTGTLMVIDDHVNLLGVSPLTGPNDDRLGPRFPDMSEAYSRRLRGVADEVAAAVGVPVAHGVYAAVPGPSYETPAEIRYLRGIGADAVGMSTVPEVIAARHMGLEVLGISCITNMAAGVLPQPLVHDEVMETARRVRGRFATLLEAVIARL